MVEALGGVALLGGGIPVGIANDGVEAGFGLELALRTAAGGEVGKVRPGTDGIGWCLCAAELVVAIAEALDGLGASVNGQVWG